MTLAKQIVVKNEFTIRQNGRGSRGSTPGKYVTQYMSRHDATDAYFPLHDGQLIERFSVYNARERQMDAVADEHDATPLHNPDPIQLKRLLRSSDGLSGRAFGSSGLSLSDETLHQDAKRIQEAFRQGHAVQKIVLSFEEDYLRDEGVLDADFTYKGRGSYQGAVDQLKLRHAVRFGMEHLAKTGGFASPVYVATIQMDTAHVHAHIAMVDERFSRKRRRYDGAERGVLYQRELNALRTGVHRGIVAGHHLEPLTVQSKTDARHIRTLVKDTTYHHVKEMASVQLLLASLPQDDTLWSFENERPIMAYPNELALHLVRRIQKGAGREAYEKAVDAVDRYAQLVTDMNGLNEQEHRAYRKAGRARIDRQSVNHLYGALRTIPIADRSVKTPMLSVQSRDDRELLRLMEMSGDKSDVTTARFALRLRHYGARLDDHKVQSRTFYDAGVSYDDAQVAGMTDASSLVMRRYYEEEQRYHMGVTDKYRQFLSFHDRIDEADQSRLLSRYDDLQQRFAERAIFTTKDEQAYRRDLHRYAYDCFEKGFGSLVTYEAQVDYERDGHVAGRMVRPIEPKHWRMNHTPRGIERVNAYDLHDIWLDFHDMDHSVSEQVVMDYHAVYYGRVEAYERAKWYVEGTKQSLPFLDGTERELRRMDKTASYVAEHMQLPDVSLSNDDVLFPRNESSIAVDTTYPVHTAVVQAIEEERHHEEERRMAFLRQASVREAVGEEEVLE